MFVDLLIKHRELLNISDLSELKWTYVNESISFNVFFQFALLHFHILFQTSQPFSLELG